MTFSKVFLILIVSAVLSSCWARVAVSQQADSLREPAVGNEVATLGDSLMIVFQDRQGHYWFGSRDEGVYKYDGKRVLQYTISDGLLDHRILRIQEDEDGKIYFNTMKGMSQWDGHTIKSLVFDENSSPQHGWQLKPGDLWFQGDWDENGPYRYDGESLYHLKFPEHPLGKVAEQKFSNTSYSPYGIYTIHKDAQGNIWFGTSNLGVCRYDGQAHHWIYEEELTELDDGPAPGVRSILVDSKGDFWFSNDLLHRYRMLPPNANGAFQYERTEGIRSSTRRDLISSCMSMVEDNQGDVWMVTYDDGVWRFDGKEMSHYQVTDGDAPVALFSAYIDRQGRIWLGSHREGAFVFNGQSFERFVPGAKE